MSHAKPTMKEIDATGLLCPMPVLRLQKALRNCPPQTKLRLLASDPMAAIDVPHFCAENDHGLLHQESQIAAAPGGADLLIFEIEKH